MYSSNPIRTVGIPERDSITGITILSLLFSTAANASGRLQSEEIAVAVDDMNRDLNVMSKTSSRLDHL